MSNARLDRYPGLALAQATLSYSHESYATAAMTTHESSPHCHLQHGIRITNPPINQVRSVILGKRSDPTQ
jgi:uncharacterized protein (DUF885 family)